MPQDKQPQRGLSNQAARQVDEEEPKRQGHGYFMKLRRSGTLSHRTLESRFEFDLCIPK